MSDRTELRAAAAARKPVVYKYDDGRQWEFPGDISADAFLIFIEEHGEEVTAGGALSLPATRDFFEMVLGDKFADIRKEVSWRELSTMAWELYFHYQGIDRTKLEDGDGDPPAETASPSSTST